MLFPLPVAITVLFILFLFTLRFALEIARVYTTRGKHKDKDYPQMVFFDCFILKIWTDLASGRKDGRKLKVAIYGAGLHTCWINGFVNYKKLDSPDVVCVFDDGEPRDIKLFGKKPLRTGDVNPEDVDLVLISSDVYFEEMTKKAEEKFGAEKVLNIYKGFPPGPLKKSFLYLDYQQREQA